MRKAAREARDTRERRGVDRVDSHLAWPVSLIPPVAHVTHHGPWPIADFLSILRSLKSSFGVCTSHN